MASPVASLPSGFLPRARVRLRVALACSALLHLLCASLAAPEWRPGLAPGFPRPVPVTVRIEPAPLPSGRAVVAVQAPSRPARVQSRRPDAVEPPRSPREAGFAAADRMAAIAVPSRTDATVYPAGELDTLPAPVLPLELGRLLDPLALPAATVQLLIDERGFVNEASFAGRGASTALERALLGALSATAFVPARKDGRAVKSRITLSLGLGPGRAGE